MKKVVFFPLLKFTVPSFLFILSSNSHDKDIPLISLKQGLNNWGKRKWSYFGYDGSKWKNKGTLFPPTFKVTAYALGFWAVTLLTQYTLVWVTTARLSPILQNIVFHPDLLAVGGSTCDMCDYSQTGLNWSTLQSPW